MPFYKIKMKKALFTFLMLALMPLLSSCPKGYKPEKSTTYSVNYNVTHVSGVKLNLTFFEYNDIEEKVGNNSMNDVATGSSMTFTANGRATKVKVYVKYYLDSDPSKTSYRWVQQVFYLNQGSNINIDINDSTIIGNNEP